MASKGHYKAVQSSDDRLEVKRAGKAHHCAGIAVERGQRPGRLMDVWMLGRSRRCSLKIKANEYYVSNRILPSHVLATLPNYDQCWPTCLFCAVETYPEAFSGPVVAQHLRPVTAERRIAIHKGLVEILDDTRAMAIFADDEPVEGG